MQSWWHPSYINHCCLTRLPSVLWRCWLGGRKGIRPVKNMAGGWWRWALLSPDGVAPSRMVIVSASVNLPLHHKVQKFSSGTGSPGWSRLRCGCGVVLSDSVSRHIYVILPLPRYYYWILSRATVQFMNRFYLLYVLCIYQTGQGGCPSDQQVWFSGDILTKISTRMGVWGPCPSGVQGQSPLQEADDIFVKICYFVTTLRMTQRYLHSCL